MAECAPFMVLRLVLATPLLVLLACAADRTAAPPARTPVTSAPASPASSPATTTPALVEPPGIRLPTTFKPAAQRVRLQILPASPSFSGTTEIDATLAEPSEVVWLNADVLDITSAVARVGGEEVRAEPVRAMVARGMKELCGTADPTEAWRRLFRRGDRVGIKVNPVGAPHSI